MIRVAMILRSTSVSVKGGDTVQAHETARQLSLLGINVDVKLTNETIDYDAYDLLHFFNITRPADILFHTAKTKKPYVVSTILVDYSEYDRQHRKGLAGFVFRFLKTDTIEYLKTIARRIKGNDRLMSNAYVWSGQKRSVQKVLKHSAMVLPNSLSEYERLNTQYNYHNGYMVVPNGIDPVMFSCTEKNEKDDLLVICAARTEGIKNQLNLIRAMNNTEFKLLLIGDAAPNQAAYAKECRELAAKNISFAGHLNREELVQYYRKAKVHVLPSWFETTGLSSLEAAAMGCNIVVAERGDVKEYFGDDAFYCDPASPQSIYHAVKKAADSPCNESLRNKIANEFTWQQAGKRTAEAYKKILSAPCS